MCIVANVCVMAPPTADVARLVEQHSDVFTVVQASNRVRCKFTGHEVPTDRADQLEEHLKSDKLRKAREWYAFDYKIFEPDIIPDRNDARRLYCRITKKPLNRIPDEVKRHVAGKTFRRLQSEAAETTARRDALRAEKDRKWAIRNANNAKLATGDRVATGVNADRADTLLNEYDSARGVAAPAAVAAPSSHGRAPAAPAAPVASAAKRGADDDDGAGNSDDDEGPAFWQPDDSDDDGPEDDTGGGDDGAAGKAASGAGAAGRLARGAPTEKTEPGGAVAAAAPPVFLVGRAGLAPAQGEVGEGGRRLSNKERRHRRQDQARAEAAAAAGGETAASDDPASSSAAAGDSEKKPVDLREPTPQERKTTPKPAQLPPTKKDPDTATCASTMKGGKPKRAADSSTKRSVSGGQPQSSTKRSKTA